MDNKKSTWFKEIGSDAFGAVKVGCRWVGFSCLHCARFMYLEKMLGGTSQRWQGPPSQAIWKAMNSPEIECHGADWHRELDRMMRSFGNV